MNFFNLSVAAPLTLLAFIPAAIVIGLAYRKRHHSSVKQVATLFLLKHFETKQPISKRPFPPKRLLFELLLLTLLVTVLAKPYYTTERPVALLIDDSLSMSAYSAGQSSYARALTELANLRTSLDSETVIFSTSTSSTLNVEDVPLEATPTKDLLQTRIETLHQTAEFKRIIAITDRVPTGQFPAWLSLRGVANSNPKSNVAIEHAAFSDQDPNKLKVRVRAFTLDATEISLLVYPWNSTTKPLLQQSLRLNAGESQTAELKLDPVAGKHDALIVKLDIDPKADAIEKDNWFYIVKRKQTKVIGVLSSEPFNSLGLKEIESLRFAELSDNQEYDGYIYHLTAPTSETKKPAIYINSGSPNVKMEVSKQKQLATAIDPLHPIARYLDFRLIKPSLYAFYSIPSWSQAIVATEEGPIVVSSIFQGNRQAYSGINLLPFSTDEHSTFSAILFINLLKWTFLDGHANQKPLTPSKELLAIEQSSVGRPINSLSAIRTGLIKDGDNFLAFNFFDEDESNLLKPKTLSIPTKLMGSLTTKANEIDQSLLIISILATLLIVDLYVFYFIIR